MAEELQGTVALVTGAGSGIGEATARLLAQHGATVAIAARRKDRLDGPPGQIEHAGGRALAIEPDVTDRARAEAMVQRTVEELGRRSAGRCARRSPSATCACRSSSPAPWRPSYRPSARRGGSSG